MEKNKKYAIILSTIGLVLLVVGVSYSFFNYTRTGTANTVNVGRISFNSNQTNTITLLGAFPIDKDDVDSSTYVGTSTITITGDTEYTEGVEYQLTVTGLSNTINNKQIPIDVVVTATGLGTSDNSYFTNRGSSSESSIYKVLADGTIANNDQLLVGYIKEGSTGINGTVTIKAYLDKEKIAISDTYYENATATPTPTAPTDHYGTTTEWVGDRVVLTTAEWNQLQNTVLSFQVKVEANEGTWTHNPIICTRVTNVANLHTETCNQTSNYCASDGYTGSNTTITYGNAVNLGTDTLTAGDAFDCDVNGNGVIDTNNGISTERFYYVSPYFNTQTEAFDNKYATLIYYNNFVNGSPSDGGAAYATQADAQAVGTCTYSDGCNWYGPVTAVTHLPTTSTWSNVTLKSNTRAILAEFQSTHNAKVTNSGTLPDSFSYNGKAARLLTAQEVMNGCGITQISNTTGELSNCQFLFENSGYTDNNKPTFGFWFETVWGVNSPYSICVNTSYSRSVSGPYVSFDNVGVRPAIEVPLSRIER